MTDLPVTTKNTIRRADGVALWRQIADILRGEILAGDWPAGSALPIEAALADRFGVNRHTVRRAVATLATEGLVRSDQGRGTFVLEARLSYPIGRRTRFSEIVSRQAREPGGRLIGSRIEPADVRIAGFLEIPQGTALTCLETLSVADRIPISLSWNWFPVERFPNLVAAYAESGSITSALRAEGASNYLRRWTRIHARAAEPDERDRLDLPAGASVLIADALNEDETGTPLHFTSTRFAADRIEILIESGEAEASRGS